MVHAAGLRTTRHKSPPLVTHGPTHKQPPRWRFFLRLNAQSILTRPSFFLHSQQYTQWGHLAQLIQVLMVWWWTTYPPIHNCGFICTTYFVSHMMSRIVVASHFLQKSPPTARSPAHHSSAGVRIWQIRYHTPAADIMMILWFPRQPEWRRILL
jgi:hypothetical protein